MGKGKNKLSKAKNLMWSSKPLWSYDKFIDRKLYIGEEKYAVSGKKLKIQKQILSSNIIMVLCYIHWLWILLIKKKYTFNGKKRDNKLRAQMSMIMWYIHRSEITLNNK
jgi:hypothetical protein